MQVAPVEVEYSDKPKWGQLTVPNFHGPFALYFLMLCCAALIWLAEMALPTPRRGVGGGRHWHAGVQLIRPFCPRSCQEHGLSNVWSFETCLNLQCSSTEVVLELGPVLRPKFKMSNELHPRSPRAAISLPT